MTQTLGDRIRQARARLRLTQAELARRIGISTTAMHAIESGDTDPRASRVVAMADVLEVSTDYLLGRTASGMLPAPSKPPALRTRPRTTAPVG
jgi:transcriptional regulator with XRE-family HTH domain